MEKTGGNKQLKYILLVSVPAAAYHAVGVEFTLVVEPLLTDQASHNEAFGRVCQSVGLGVIAGPGKIKCSH